VSSLRLVRLGPEHADALLAGQDAQLAREIVGRRWDRARLEEFLERAARWREDGPLREFAALDTATGALRGGGGLNALDPGLEPGQAMLTYWLLAAHRGRGLSGELAEALVEQARGWVELRELVLLIAPENQASRAVARRLGAALAGEERRHPGDASRAVERWVLALR
jgi:RimJ/RimL family protein N-acetyltransferase